MHEEAGAHGARVAVIDVSGVIYNASRPSVLGVGENPVALLQEKLDQAANDARTRAVILRLNTPGGTVTASDAMYREVQRFRRKTGKPVIALMMDVAASGGYYLACAADDIVAYPTAVTGSIGVIVQTVSFKPALDRWGIRAEAITTGPNKDAGSPLSNLTPEQRAVLQALVDDFYARFLDVVRQARPGIEPETFPRVTDGRILSGEQALKHGLVDQLGDVHDALALAKQRAGIARADLVMYRRPGRYVGSPYAAAPATPTTQLNLAQINLDTPLLGEPASGFYYLWMGPTP